MQTYRFDDFELDLDALQLRLRGEPVKIERRPLDLLILLVSRHGRLVPRGEIIAALWPANVIIDFDSGLNTLVRKVRSALSDATDIPRFIETVPGRGYRFIAPLAAATEPELPEPSPMPSARLGLRPRRDAVLLSLLLTVGAGILLWGARGFAPSELLDRGGGTAALRQVCSAALLSNLDAGTLALPPGASTGDEINIASAGINPDAVESYLRGERFLASPTETATENAIQAYNRAMIVDDRYARPYLGLGQALLRSALGPQQRRALLADDAAEIARMPAPLLDEIRQAFFAALERHATLGEAWIGLARTSPDPAEAEDRYRKGLEHAPDYGMGYVHYAGFLFRERRIAQAISTVGCGLRFAPGTPELHELDAFFMMLRDSDIAGHDRELLKLLETHPERPSTLSQLANSRWLYSGDIAEAAQFIERAIEADPGWGESRTRARDIYLDLGDPVAARAVLGDSLSPVAAMEIAQFAGDGARAAALLDDVRPQDWWDSGELGAMHEAIRDGAIATGDLEAAARRLDSVHESWEGDRLLWHRTSSLVYAHTLILAGEVDRGRRIAESIRDAVVENSVGRAENYFSRELAAAHAVLSDYDEALDQLEISVRNHRVYRWWYLAEHDPLYEHLRTDPRFQARFRKINDEARLYLDHQRALLEEMRRKAEVPKHPQ